MLAGVDAGVETDTLWVLHRGDRVWAADTFTAASGSERAADESPIAAPTVLQLSKDSGAVLRWAGREASILLFLPTVFWLLEAGL